MTKLRGIPTWFFLPALLALLVLTLPLVGMASRVPWADLPTILTSESSVDALGLSLKTCLVSTSVSVLIGTPLALIFARSSERLSRPRWLTPVRALVLIPLVMPPVVAGLALLTTFGRRGVFGPTLEAFGVQIPFTTLAVVIAQIFVSLPYLILTVETAAKAAGSHLEHAARGLGATPWIQFSRITAPLLGPSIASGAALAFARSLGEFGATITFAGSMQGTTRTLPLEVYLQREQDPDSAIALSLVLIVIAALLTALTSVLESRNMRRFEAEPAEADRDEDDPANRGGSAGASTDFSPAAGAGANVSPGAKVGGHFSSAAGGSVAGGRSAPFALVARVPERGVNYELAGRAGETLAIIGPNGSGKSTGIRLLAGDITSPEARTDVPDTVGFLDQSPSLFPHMNVLDNVAFGPRCHGAAKAEARARARAELAAVGLTYIENKAPWQLSGGQAQRVALARVLAVDPQLLLLDEPFAALDSRSSAALRSLISRRIRGLTTVIVTHDLIDVLILADRVAVLEAGELASLTDAETSLTHPATQFVADFAGLNMQFGKVSGRVLAVDGTGVRLHGELSAVDDGDVAAAVFDPRAVALRTPTTPPGAGESSIRNVIPGKVTSIRAGSAGVDVGLDIGSGAPLRATITPTAAAELGVTEGARLLAEVKAMQVRIIPVAGGLADGSTSGPTNGSVEGRPQLDRAT